MDRDFIKYLLQFLVLVFLGVGCGPSLQTDVWFEDSLVKVFPDTSTPTVSAGSPVLFVPRNGHTSVQFVVRPREVMTQFALEVTPPKEAESLFSVQLRHVGYVPVESDTRAVLARVKGEIDDAAFERAWDTPQEELIGSAPGEFPDPLYLEIPSSLESNRTESFWITIFAAGNTPPGQYRCDVRLYESGIVQLTRSFTIQVMEASVPVKQKLMVTNWLNLGRAHLAKHYDIGGDAEAYWKLVGNIARVMADHKQNVILTPISAAVWDPAVTSLVQVKWEDRKFLFDFENFDRWVETFEAAGVVGTIEGGHLLTRPKGYFSEIIVPSHVVENNELVAENLPASDPRAERYLEMLLDALYQHLEKRGWLDRYIQHVHDEPHGEEVPVYERYARLTRKHLPGVPTIDAVDLEEDTGFLSEFVDIWVPVLSSFDDRFGVLAKHREAGGVTWFYTCIVPGGRYLNRFIDQSLLKVRLLHWFNFRHGLTGYLHWGGNSWHGDPFKQVQPVINDGRTLLPAGDSHIVYPDPARMSILSSIRLETMREGIEDCELLWDLASKAPERADELVRQAVPHVNDYVRDPREFRKLYQSLLEAFD
jgi:hypothetical protein